MLDLINNLALLLSLGIVYEISTYVSEKLTRYKSVLNGCLIGLIGLLIMSIPLRFSNGVIFDTRSVLISVSALIFGTVPTIIASSILILYRIIIGGTGWFTGVVVIIACAAIGLLWGRSFFIINARHRWLNLWLFGTVVHIAVLACMFILPWPLPINIIETVGLSIIVVFPLGSVLLSLLLIHQKERHEALIKVAEADERYKSLFKNSHTVMFLIRPEDGQIIDTNPAASRFYGWPIDMLQQKKLQDICTLPAGQLNEQLHKALTGEQNYYTTRHRISSGAEVDVEIFSGPVRIQAMVLLYLIVHDISRRIVSEKAMIESENRFKMLVDNAPEAIFIQTNMTFVYANQRAVELFGATSQKELIGMPVMECIHPDYRDVVLQRIRRMNEGYGAPKSMEEVLVRLDGTVITVDVTPVPTRYQGIDGAVVFSRDISEKKSEEAQLRQQQKLEAIGILAGGVAHEINNPINGIMNYAELITDDLPTGSQTATYAYEIIQESKRISQIVKNLLQFSRYEKQTFSLEDISEIIQHSLTLIKTLIRKDQIQLQVSVDDHLPRIRCRSQQIQQVLINLITNARDALNEKYPEYHSDKILRLTCRLHECGEEKFVRIEIEDHGNGISREMQERIFEPFFSTKTKEKGTGLGLSITFGIISDHKGIINVESEEGEYTRFIVDLPTDPSSQGVNDE